jgi:restriction system protein
MCGFKRHFTPEGIPFNLPQRRKAHRVVPKIIPEATETSPKTGLDGFLSQTSGLNTHDKGLKFEQYCHRLLEAMGWEVEHSGQSGDRGVDLRAVRQDPISSQTLVVQCKHQESVSADVVIQTLGMVSASNANQGVVITTGSFTADAKKFAEENSAVDIIDKGKLAELVNQYLDG